MDIELTTPALLFPAISLLLLAYTNRFMTVATLIRSLYAQWMDNHDNVLFGQIKNLRKRVLLIRNMQACGICSLLLCVISMFCFYIGWLFVGKVTFGLSQVLLMLSLALCLFEIQISVKALDLQLKDLEGPRRARQRSKRKAAAVVDRETEPPSVTHN